MFPKLNDFVQAQLVLSTCWKHFCLKCWRCSGLFRALEAGLALREAGAQAEELTAQWGICCPVRLASAPAACWQYLALGRYLWVSGYPMSFCSPYQPCAPEGCFWMSIEWAAWATVQSCTHGSGWAVGSHSKDHRQLCLCGRGLLGLSLLSKDCPCAAFKSSSWEHCFLGFNFFLLEKE